MVHPTNRRLTPPATCAPRWRRYALARARRAHRRSWAKYYSPNRMPGASTLAIRRAAVVAVAAALA